MSRYGAVTRLIQREPVTFQACVQATLAALVGFGVVQWTPEQVGLVMGAVAAFLALLTRAWVTPTSTGTGISTDTSAAAATAAATTAAPGERDPGSGGGGAGPAVDAKNAPGVAG